MASDRCPGPLLRANMPTPAVPKTAGVRPLTPGEVMAQRREARRAQSLNTFMAASPEAKGMMPRANATTFGIPQYGPAFNRTGLNGLYAFGALAADTEAALVNFRQTVAAALARLEDAQPGFLMRGVQTLIGAGSSVSAGQEDVRQQKKLLTITDQRIAEFRASGDDLAAKAWLANARAGRWDDVSAGESAGKQMGAGALVDQVVVQSVKDTASAAATGLQAIPWIIGGTAAVAVAFFGWRAWRLYKIAEQEAESGVQAAARARLNPTGHTYKPAGQTSPAVSGLARRRRRRRRK